MPGCVGVRRRRAIGLGLAAGLLTTALLMFIGSRTLLWGLAVGFFVFFKANRSDRVLIWLRRFHRSEPGSMRMSNILQRACSGLCVPITLQDSSFNASYMAGGNRMILLYPILPATVVLLSLPAFFIYWILATSGASGLAGVAGLLAAVSGLALAVLAVRWLLTVRGYRTVHGNEATACLSKLLSAIRRRKGLGAGVLVLKCDDDNWQQAVSAALRGADAAVLDVSEPTPNVLWELREACQALSSDRVILACRLETGQAERLPPLVEALVREAVGGEMAARLAVFNYAAAQPPVGLERGRRYAAASRALRGALDQALARVEADATPAPPALWLVYPIVVVSLTSAIFIVVAAIFGPYNLKNALEAAGGSAMLGFVASLPVLGWLWWRRLRARPVPRG